VRLGGGHAGLDLEMFVVGVGVRLADVVDCDVGFVMNIVVVGGGRTFTSTKRRSPSLTLCVKPNVVWCL